MSKNREAFKAGVSTLLLAFIVVTALLTHGEVSETHTINWGDIGRVLLMMVVVGDSYADVRDYIRKR